MAEMNKETFRGSVKDRLMPVRNKAHVAQNLAQEDEDRRLAELERERKRELEEIKTRTMFNMVETNKLTINGQVSDRKFVYLTHSQSFLFNSTSIEKLLGALELKHEPQLCIRLLPSAFGLEFCSSQSRDRKISGRHSSSENFIEHGARGCIHAPTPENRDLLESDARLLDFMKEVLLPLAISTNAVILMQGGSECDMAKACERACQPLFARYGKNFPFTIICVQSATAFGGVVAAADPTEYEGITSDDVERAKKSIAWQYLNSSKHSKNKRIKKAVENRFGPNVGAWSAYDAVGWCTHYIMTESVVGESSDKLKRDSSDFNHVSMLLSSYYAQNIPTICFTTFGINPSATFGRGGTRYAPHANLVRREIPIVFLDCRRRNVMYLDTELTDDHPVATLLKHEAGDLQNNTLSSEDEKTKVDDTSLEEPTNLNNELARKNRRQSLSQNISVQKSILNNLKNSENIPKHYKIKCLLLKIALEGHSALIDKLLKCRPVPNSNDVVLNDSWSNCTLAYFKMILDADTSLMTKIDIDGKAEQEKQPDNITKQSLEKSKGHKGGVVPLYEKISQLQKDEMSNVEGMSKLDDNLIDSVIEYLILEDIRQHWGVSLFIDSFFRSYTVLLTLNLLQTYVTHEKVNGSTRQRENQEKVSNYFWA